MLKLGLPSKGRLMEQSFDWFAGRGIRLSRSGSDREYAARAEGVEGLSLVLLSAGEIPRELAAGRIHLGVTGSDLIREKLAGWRSDVVELAPMGFGHADLVLAVPACWRDCETLDDFASIARDFRAAHGFRLRIATKYPRIATRHFLETGRQAEIVEVKGSVELAPLTGLAEAIVDLTATGTTLRENGLVIREEIAHCTARLIANRVAHKLKAEAIDALLERIGAV